MLVAGNNKQDISFSGEHLQDPARFFVVELPFGFEIPELIVDEFCDRIKAGSGSAQGIREHQIVWFNLVIRKDTCRHNSMIPGLIWKDESLSFFFK